MTQNASVNTNCTTAMAGMKTTYQVDAVAEEQQQQREQRDQPEDEVRDRGRRGRDRQDDLREVDLLDQPFLPDDRRDRVVDAAREPLPRQDRAEDEERVVGHGLLEDEVHEDDVDEHLEQRIEDPPEVAEERVGALLLQVRPGEVADEPAPRPDLAPSPRGRVRRAPGRRALERKATSRWPSTSSWVMSMSGRTVARPRPAPFAGVAWPRDRPRPRCRRRCRRPSRAAAPAARRAPSCMLTHSYYEEDPRVRREAEALVAAGRPVDVFALRRPGDPATGTRRRRPRPPPRRPAPPGRRPRHATSREYLAFFVRASLAATAGQPAAPGSRWSRSTPCRTSSSSRRSRSGSPACRWSSTSTRRCPSSSGCASRAPRVRCVQRRSCSRSGPRSLAADAVITVNDALADGSSALGVPPGKVTVVLNSPDLARFDPARFAARAFMADGTLRLVYAGALTPTYELDVAIDAMARAARCRPDLPVALDIYGRGDAEPRWRRQAATCGLADARPSSTAGSRSRTCPAALAAADIGLAPTRRTAFTDFSLSTKIFEYARDGQAGRRVAPAAGRADVPGRVRRDLRAGRRARHGGGHPAPRRRAAGARGARRRDRRARPRAVVGANESRVGVSRPRSSGADPTALSRGRPDGRLGRTDAATVGHRRDQTPHGVCWPP